MPVSDSSFLHGIIPSNVPLSVAVLRYHHNSTTIIALEEPWEALRCRPKLNSFKTLSFQTRKQKKLNFFFHCI